MYVCVCVRACVCVRVCLYVCVWSVVPSKRPVGCVVRWTVRSVLLRCVIQPIGYVGWLYLTVGRCTVVVVVVVETAAAEAAALLLL